MTHREKSKQPPIGNTMSFHISSIEHLSIELWFMIFDFFNLLEIHRAFYNLNTKINSIIHGKQCLQLYLDDQNDSSDLNFLFQNVWSLKFFSQSMFQLISPYISGLYFKELRALDFCQPHDAPLFLTNNLLRELKHLEFLSIYSTTHDSFRVLTHIFEYLTNQNENVNSIKRLVFRGQVLELTNNKSTNMFSKKINLDSLYIRSISPRTFSLLIPQYSQIHKIQIGSLIEDVSESSLIKSHTIAVHSLTIDHIGKCNIFNANYDFDNIKYFIDQFIHLKILNVKDTTNTSLVNGDKWALLLKSTSIEKFSLKYSCYCNRNGCLTSDEQLSMSIRFLTGFWIQEKKAVLDDWISGGIYYFSVKF